MISANGPSGGLLENGAEGGPRVTGRRSEWLVG